MDINYLTTTTVLGHVKEHLQFTLSRATYFTNKNVSIKYLILDLITTEREDSYRWSIT